MHEYLPWLGNTVAAFLTTLGGLAAPAAWMAGRGVASTWRSPWQAVVYSGLLAAAHRFADYALAGGDLVAPAAFAVAWAVLAAVALASWRRTRAAMMVAQYPWLYVRAGPFDWRDKAAG